MSPASNQRNTMQPILLFLVPIAVYSSPIPTQPTNLKLSPLVSNSVGSSAKSLFQTIEASTAESENVMISPLSIHLAMSLLYNGVQGKSKEELRQVMGLVNVTDETFLEESRNLLLSYSELKRKLITKIELANVMFADDTFKLNEGFQNTLNTYYLTEVNQVDYSNEDESTDIINNWVSNKTNNLIEDLIPQGYLSEDTRLMLLNAVYFKANWQVPFPQFLTRKKQFDLSNDSSVEVDMMFQESEILYGEDEDLQSQVISLQYEDPNFTMILILPDEETPLDSLSSNLIHRDFNMIHQSLNQTELLLEMPKFKMGYKTDLTGAFEALGVKEIFSNTADLSNIADELLHVSGILHQTEIEVNEEGSEAAAVTGIQIDTRVAVAGSGPKIVKVNRPFMFVIQDLKNNIPLFMGRIVNPAGKNQSADETVHETEEPKLNLIGERNESPFALLEAFDSEEEEEYDSDPQELAHITNYPGYEIATNCDQGNESSDNDRILFPCPTDTQPIEDYKKKTW